MLKKLFTTTFLMLLAGVTQAEPFSLENMPTHVPVPVPAHVASQAQAAAEQRAQEIEAGAATVWGTAQADLFLSQLRAMGVLPEEIVPNGIAKNKNNTASSPEAIPQHTPPSAPEQAATEVPDTNQSLPTLLLDLNEELLRFIVTRFYSGLSDERLHECTLAFRKNTAGVMRDTLLTLSGAYSVLKGSEVEWNALIANVESILDHHREMITNIFVDALKNAATRSEQSTVEDIDSRCHMCWHLQQNSPYR